MNRLDIPVYNNYVSTSKSLSQRSISFSAVGANALAIHDYLI
jgi:hypothetical protein